MPKYTIIVENDISDWEDATGTRYHFPKRYLKFLEPGTKVIYYKGKLTDNNFKLKRLSNLPHYFGCATIGQIWQDEENVNNNFAEIIDYIPFSKPVNFKKDDRNYYEIIPESKTSNYWRDGVRECSHSIYNEIIKASNIILDGSNEAQIDTSINNPGIIVQEPLLKYYTKSNKKISTDKASPRYNQESKKVGDHGEKLVIECLKTNLSPKIADSITWHAISGETPGYDISYLDIDNNLICIEVKTTTGKLFNNFIMTVNELNAASSIGDNYKIFLVADCFSNTPKIYIMDNPTLNDRFKFDPISYNVYQTE